VGQACVNAAARLDKRLQKRARGLIVEGYRDDGRVAAFDRQFPHLAAGRDMLNINPLPGVRDAYAWPSGGVLIWDYKHSYWYDRKDISLADLLRRYAFFATYGNPNPAVEDILGDLTATIGVRLEPRDTIVPPKGSTTIAVFAQRMDGQEAITLISLRTKREATFGTPFGIAPGGGTVSPSVVEPGNTVTWTAPDTENYVYRVTASLTAARYETLIGEPYCLIGTGVSTQIKAYAEPGTVEPEGDGNIIFQIVDRDGDPVQVRGHVGMRAYGLQLDLIYWVNEAEAKGTAAYHAPKREAYYQVLISFSGYIDAGVFTGMNALPSEAEVFVQVKSRGEAAAAAIAFVCPVTLNYVTRTFAMSVSLRRT